MALIGPLALVNLALAVRPGHAQTVDPVHAQIVSDPDAAPVHWGALALAPVIQLGDLGHDRMAVGAPGEGGRRGEGAREGKRFHPADIVTPSCYTGDGSFSNPHD